MLFRSVYVIVGVIGLVHHEMWRDEVFPWLLAKASGSLRELFANLWYDAAHFPAWHLILWVLTRFTHNIVAMQIVHLFVASAAVGLFVFYSPFSKTQKLLFCFGYFPVFEYCVICRMYGLVWPLLFLFARSFPRDTGRTCRWRRCCSPWRIPPRSAPSWPSHWRADSRRSLRSRRNFARAAERIPLLEQFCS